MKSALYESWLEVASLEFGATDIDASPMNISLAQRLSARTVVRWDGPARAGVGLLVAAEWPAQGPWRCNATDGARGCPHLG